MDAFAFVVPEVMRTDSVVIELSSVSRDGLDVTESGLDVETELD